jgi:predicted RNase H-like nuclease (RuvC/YqgF family)
MTPDMRSQISSLQASFMLFRDKCMDDISSLQAKVLKLESVVDEQNREILSLREKCERNLPDGHQNELVSNEIGQTNMADTELLPSTMENEDLVNGHQNEIASNELAQANMADTELLPPTMQNEDLTVNAVAISVSSPN